jgi:protein associated with RNAse G/E
VDLKDFEQNARRYDYSAEVQTNASRALIELVDLIESRTFPFTDSKVINE